MIPKETCFKDLRLFIVMLYQPASTVDQFPLYHNLPKLVNPKSRTASTNFPITGSI